MGMLGISIYPEHMNQNECEAYLEVCASLGYRRLFVSMVQLPTGEAGRRAFDQFQDVVRFAKDHGFKVMVDVVPEVAGRLNLMEDGLRVLADMGIWGARLVDGFSPKEIARMTHNNYNMKIEVNAVRTAGKLGSIMRYAPLVEQLMASYSFYPQVYTGLSDQSFLTLSQQFHEYNIRTAAFISSSAAAFGPWPVEEGLPTRESDRYRDIATQVHSLRLTGAIEDLIIGNALATYEELSAAANAFFAPYPRLRVAMSPQLTATEHQVFCAPYHVSRGDGSEGLLRAKRRRKDAHIAARPGPDWFDVGDVVIVNDRSPYYQGEIQIVTRRLPDNGRRNLIGRVIPDDLTLLPQLPPWGLFKLAPTTETARECPYAE